MATPVERMANAELSHMLARITADVLSGASFPAAVVTAVKGEERVMLAALDWRCDDDEREDLKRATWTIFGGLLAGVDALAMVFDSILRSDGDDDHQHCLFGAAIRLDADRKGLLVNQLVVPYHHHEDGSGAIDVPFAPEEIAMEQTIYDALLDGLEHGPIEPDQAAQHLNALEHSALTDPALLADSPLVGMVVIIDTAEQEADPRLN